MRSVEAWKHSGRGTTTETTSVKFIMMITEFSFNMCARPSAWRLTTVAMTILCFLCFLLQRNNHPWKFALTFDLLFFSPAGALAGATINAFMQVHRRRKWFKETRFRT